MMIDSILLFPYSITLLIRNALYRKGSKRVRKAEVPTICVGNITVGGTGKTPHTELILRMLAESERWHDAHVAMLSRGYKRKSRGFQRLLPDDNSLLGGDEPLQVCKKFPSVTVAVDKNRLEGCDFLVHPEKLRNSPKAKRCKHKDLPAADIIVLDDAYQYRKLGADLNIVLVDYSRPVTKDSLMPIGRLRDLPQRLYDADVVIVSKCPSYLMDDGREEMARTLGFCSYDQENCRARTSRGKEVTLLFTYTHYCESLPVYPETDNRYMYAQKVILFSGIAKDTPLLNYLSDRYKVVRHFTFPDHHKYKKADISSILSAVKHQPTAAVATTEKDAQRLLDYRAMPARLKERLFMVPIRAAFLSENEEMIFRSIIDNIRV